MTDKLPDSRLMASVGDERHQAEAFFLPHKWALWKKQKAYTRRNSWA